MSRYYGTFHELNRINSTCPKCGPHMRSCEGDGELLGYNTWRCRNCGSTGMEETNSKVLADGLSITSRIIRFLFGATS